MSRSKSLSMPTVNLGETIFLSIIKELKRNPERMHKVLDELSDLHLKKSKDYGTPGDPYANVRASRIFGIEPWIGVMVRANDKFVRIASMIRNGRLENESLTDSIRDISVYCLIALVLLEEEK